MLEQTRSEASGLPSFLVIGAMKGGTTSLYEYLGRHPQIFMSEVKELHYFTPHINWGKGLAWYREQFQGSDGALAVGEASTSYSKYPDVTGVPERIRDLLPDVRLIYLVRHPIERIRSQYLHQVLMGEERRPFDIAVTSEPRYVNYSRYAMQLDRYLGCFERDRILVIPSESFRDDRQATLASVFRFLGVDDHWRDPAFEREFHRTSEKQTARPQIRRLYEAPWYQAISTRVPERLKDLVRPVTRWSIEEDRAVVTPELFARLQEGVRDDVVRLKAFLGPAFDGWGLA